MSLVYKFREEILGPFELRSDLDLNYSLYSAFFLTRNIGFYVLNF